MVKVLPLMAPTFATQSVEIHTTMFKISTLALCCAALLFTSCGTNAPNGSSTAGTDSSKPSDPPVETKSPNTDYKPAFTGQTRIGGVKTSTAYEGKSISEGLKNPWGIAVLPSAGCPSLVMRMTLPNAEFKSWA